MGQREFDMEVTDHRANVMLKTLCMLYADQMGLEIEDIKIIKKESGEKEEQII